MKKILIILGTVLSVCGCGFLDRYPEDGPSDATFYSNETELNLALNASYTGLYCLSNDNVQYQLFFDGATEIFYIRGTYANMGTVQSGQHTSQTNIFNSFWAKCYERICEANMLLDNMHRAKDTMSDETYNQIEAQARFLRAYQYIILINLYGDVPYVDKTLAFDEGKLVRNTYSSILKRIYKDLDFAAEHLPETWPSTQAGRITKGTALGYKARAALYAGDYATAEAASKAIIESGIYEMHPDFESLFHCSGINSKEVLLNLRFDPAVHTTKNGKYITTRINGGYSIISPLQTLVDMYRCTDGKNIAESPLYNPAKPYENRDPRLKATILYEGEWHNGYRFCCHPDSTMTDHIVGDKIERVANTDATHTAKTYTGYVGRKYCDPTELPTLVEESRCPFILMRYPEILLTYAESMIEQGKIDESVVSAINTVRQRPGVMMPKVEASMSVEELRDVVRYERVAELAMEGFHLFDIRRWKTAEHLMQGNINGRRTKKAWYKSLTPSFNEWGKPYYSEDDETSFESLGKMVFDPSKDYVWPIPQNQIDLNPLLEEEPVDVPDND